jgi:hypothetical protein
MKPRLSALAVSAHHEAGHAVVAWREKIAIRSISIVPDEATFGRVRHQNPLSGIRLDCDGSNRARLRAEKIIRMCLAGPAAQRKYRPRSSWVRGGSGDDGDFARALDLVTRISGSAEHAAAYYKLLEIEARSLVDLWWPQIQLLAAELLIRRKITGRDVMLILAGAPLFAAR